MVELSEVTPHCGEGHGLLAVGGIGVILLVLLLLMARKYTSGPFSRVSVFGSFEGVHLSFRE